MVKPHCDQEPEGMPPGMPAFVQSAARLGEIMPVHGACARVLSDRIASKITSFKYDCGRIISALLSRGKGMSVEPPQNVTFRSDCRWFRLQVSASSFCTAYK